MSSASTVAPASSQTAIAASTAHTATANNAPTRTNMRSSSQVKNPDGARRQSPIDAASRRGPTQKAWTGGTNPLTQRGHPSPASHSNGVASSTKPSKMPAAKDTGLSDRHAHDRSVAAFGAAMGSTVTVSTRTGDRYRGFMAGASLVPNNAKITLKMTKKLPSSSGTSANGLGSREAALVGSSPEYAMTWDVRDLVEIDLDDLSLVETVKQANGSSSKFRTDADISGNLHRGARPLQKWVPDGPDDTDYSLDAGSTGDWDQFATARQMTGIESTYHENDYTTALDKNSLSYKMKEAEAERVEREILGTASSNIHIREERGQQVDHGADDEEAKYSGVRRSQPPFVPLSTALTSKQAPPVEPAAQKRAQNTSVSPQRPAPTGGQTEGVEGRLLHSFREFKDTEKQKLLDRKRQQANQDRTAKLNELLRFSRTFKLKTPVPTDLVGILAKDPVKQEAIIEKNKKEHEESSSAKAGSSATTSPEASAKKASESTQVTATPDRQQAPNRARGGFGQPASARGASQQAALGGRGSGVQRNAGAKPLQAHQIPAPIPILDGRAPPTGPTADAAALTSPQRSSVQTPTSAASSKFNLSVKAAEFRPTAPSFNPSVSSNTPSSPASVQRTTSVSRAASPSSFFGAHKPKPRSERRSIADKFNPIVKMKAEVAARVAGSESSKPETGVQGPHKDYAANGGIPYAYQTVPRWNVRQENEDKTYKTPFERPAPPTPQTSRASATPHMSYPSHISHMPPGPGHTPHVANAQHMQANGPHHYGQYDDGHGRPVIPMGPPYAASTGPSRQTSAYASPLVPGAQLVYGGSQQYYAVNNGQMPMPMRYAGTPMHQPGQMATPMMVPQQPNGFMPAPQPYGPQMPMYSPNPSHVYPQVNGYGSPGRAPMMMQQGSQQSHHHAQPMMYTLSQGGPMGYPQGQAPMGRGYGGQYGSSPQQHYGMQQRTMSSGYGQKVMQHQQQYVQQAPPMNAPQQPAAYSQVEVGPKEGK
ncbi:hypothetical protein DV738_g630, partial [Chaetothyriales sp. CBS 135597]